ncbi:hypothetical protein GCM10012275_49120 [Longimycelium tulufanense]|uniref:Uncharacterized protein n=1 Tax=Longimycelium tulufanense TaxID=907463 RepID=A0A8J3CI58_9PSEU|nr:hypothetical protein [Longimycelium tulufanense]GGM72659.1 hypothetical protein GCM10012275_49120 [Longimycelium tulufanense]
MRPILLIPLTWRSLRRVAGLIAGVLAALAGTYWLFGLGLALAVAALVALVVSVVVWVFRA